MLVLMLQYQLGSAVAPSALLAADRCMAPSSFKKQTNSPYLTDTLPAVTDM